MEAHAHGMDTNSDTLQVYMYPVLSGYWSCAKVATSVCYAKLVIHKFGVLGVMQGMHGWLANVTGMKPYVTYSL